MAPPVGLSMRALGGIAGRGRVCCNAMMRRVPSRAITHVGGVVSRPSAPPMVGLRGIVGSPRMSQPARNVRAFGGKVKKRGRKQKKRQRNRRPQNDNRMVIRLARTGLPGDPWWRIVAVHKRRKRDTLATLEELGIYDTRKKELEMDKIDAPRITWWATIGGATVSDALYFQLHEKGIVPKRKSPYIPRWKHKRIAWLKKQVKLRPDDVHLRNWLISHEAKLEKWKKRQEEKAHRAANPELYAEEEKAIEEAENEIESTEAVEESIESADEGASSETEGGTEADTEAPSAEANVEVGDDASAQGDGDKAE